MTAIMSTYQHFGQRTFEERSPSSDFDEPEPPMVVCDAGDAPPVVIRAGAVAPPMSFEENIALLQSAKQDGCISYSRSRAGSRALSEPAERVGRPALRGPASAAAASL